jgi:sulfur transfer complex TusBCD TusB component (DsrH family)
MILSLPPWLCNKQKYIMMSGLILGSQQPVNDFDTYFMPLVEDLKVMWYNDGVQVWNEHKHEYFQLKAILFVIVSDSPAARNLLGQSKKVCCRFSHCFRETYSQYLSESQKIVYMGHRCYIPMKHQFWSMKDQFNGNTKKRHPPPHLIGHEVYEIIKDVHIVLGKQKRTGKFTEEDDMWKKKSIGKT